MMQKGSGTTKEKESVSLRGGTQGVGDADSDVEKVRNSGLSGAALAAALQAVARLARRKGRQGHGGGGNANVAIMEMLQKQAELFRQYTEAMLNRLFARMASSE